MYPETPAEILLRYSFSVCEDGNICADNIYYDIGDIIAAIGEDKKALKSFQDSIRAVQNHCVDYLMETARA